MPSLHDPWEPQETKWHPHSTYLGETQWPYCKKHGRDPSSAESTCTSVSPSINGNDIVPCIRPFFFFFFNHKLLTVKSSRDSLNEGLPTSGWHGGGVVLVALTDVGGPTVNVDGTFRSQPDKRAQKEESFSFCPLGLHSGCGVHLSRCCHHGPFADLRTSLSELSTWTEDQQHVRSWYHIGMLRHPTPQTEQP